MADIICGQPLPCTMTDHGNGNIRVTLARIDLIHAKKFGAVGMYVSNTTQTQIAEILSVPAVDPTDDSYYYEIDVAFPDGNWVDTDRCGPQANNAIEAYATQALLVAGAPADGSRILFWAKDTNNLEDWQEKLGRIAHNWSCFGMTPRCGITQHNAEEWYRPQNNLDDDLLFENMSFISGGGAGGTLDFINFAKGTADTIEVKRCYIGMPAFTGAIVGIRISGITGAVNFRFTDCIMEGGGNVIAVATSAACNVRVVGCTIVNGGARAIDGNNITTAVNCYLHGTASARNTAFSYCATSDAQGDIVPLRNLQLEELNYPKRTVAIGRELELPLGSVLAGEGTPDADSIYDIRGVARDDTNPTVGANEGVAIGIEGGGAGDSGIFNRVFN